MHSEMKVPLGVAEAEALAAWLEDVAGMLSNEPVPDHETAAEAREWARVVKPVPVKRRR